MKKDIDYFFAAAVQQVTNITYQTKKDIVLDTQTTYHFSKPILCGLFYRYNCDKVIEIDTKKRYRIFNGSANIGDLIIDPRKIIPARTILNDLNIDIPKKAKISSNKLRKTLVKKYPKKTQFN